MGVLKNYQVKIEALSPVYIGSGDKISKKEYIYIPWEQLVIVPDIRRMYKDLQRKGKGQAFIDYMLHNNKDTLGIWLKQCGYQKKDYAGWKRYGLQAGDAFLTRDAKAKDIACFIKDPYGMPYVPGSSLKGMIRTALLAWEITRNPSAYNRLRESVKQNAGQNRRNALSREAEGLEAETFHTLARGDTVLKKDAVCCNLSGLIISDSRPIPVSQLVLSQKIDYTLKGEEKPLPILRESLCPGTGIYFDLTIDTQVCPYTLEDILEALDCFQKLCYDCFYKRFGRGKKEPGIVWLGGGVGFLSKTVMYPLLGADAFRTVNAAFKETLGRNIYNMHKHQKDLSLKLSPHVCKCTRYSGALYDMGMGRIEVL